MAELADFPSPDEVFSDHPNHLQLYKSMIGRRMGGAPITTKPPAPATFTHTGRSSAGCSRRFSTSSSACRRSFHREACSACVDNIKMVHGSDPAELANFKRVIREESNKQEQIKNKHDKLPDSKLLLS